MSKIEGTNFVALQEYLQRQLDRAATEPINRQLYRALRSAILQGRLTHGRALPPSRTLATELAVARNTVLHAYEQLCAEGYCVSRSGAGTFVAGKLPDPCPLPVVPDGQGEASPGLSARGRQLLGKETRRLTVSGNAFVPGQPDLAAFPWHIWHKLLLARQRRASPDDYDYRNEGGHAALKAALADYLRLSRGVNCLPDQILITGGMQQSLGLIAQTLADPGDVAWIEEPGYLGARRAWQAASLAIHGVPLDEEGLAWQGCPLPSPRLIYVTPSHQYPLGHVLSLARRQALLQEAAQHGAWVVEDDYDSEFRHRGRPLAAMQGLDSVGRVIYLGTFSKVMFPALRLGYLVAPMKLVDPLRRLQARLYRESDYITQAALADFITLGHFGSHLRRMRGIYARRQAKLRDTLAEQLGDALPLLGGEAGMHVTARLPDGSDDEAISRALALRGLVAAPLSNYCGSAPPFPGLVLGYAGLDDAAVRLAAVQLARALLELGVLSRSGDASPAVLPHPPTSRQKTVAH
ncbi:aminotransferase-like domain-containing protein [Chitinimonas naiadis]